jgi:hypothetical protein
MGMGCGGSHLLVVTQDGAVGELKGEREDNGDEEAAGLQPAIASDEEQVGESRFIGGLELPGTPQQECLKPTESPIIAINPPAPQRVSVERTPCKYDSYQQPSRLIAPRRSGVRVPLAPPRNVEKPR